MENTSLLYQKSNATVAFPGDTYMLSVFQLLQCKNNVFLFFNSFQELHHSSLSYTQVPFYLIMYTECDLIICPDLFINFNLSLTRTHTYVPKHTIYNGCFN